MSGWMRRRPRRRGSWTREVLREVESRRGRRRRCLRPSGLAKSMRDEQESVIDELGSHLMLLAFDLDALSFFGVQ